MNVLKELILKKVYADGTIVSPLPTDLFTIVGNLTNLIIPIVIITFLGILIYGGYLRMTAAGDPDQEAKSMQVITGAIVGFIIIVLAPVLVSLVRSLLQVS